MIRIRKTLEYSFGGKYSFVEITLEIINQFDLVRNSFIILIIIIYAVAKAVPLRSMVSEGTTL